MKSGLWKRRQRNTSNQDSNLNQIQKKTSGGLKGRSKGNNPNEPMDSEITEAVQDEINVEVPSRASIGTVARKLRDQIPALEAMSPTNYEELLDQFRSTFDEAADTSEQHAKDYVEKAGALEAALAALAEYNRKALEQLSKLTMEAIQAADAPNAPPGMNKIEAAEALVEKAKLLVQTAEKQLEYSKQIGNVARPLALWRLDASKAVWEAQNALKLAECKYTEAKDRVAGPVLPKTTNTVPARNLSERSEQISVPSDDQKPKKPPGITFPKAPTLSFRSHRSTSFASEGSVESSISSFIPDEVKIDQREPIKFWPKHTYHSPDGQEICYVRAPKDCLRKKNGIKCTFSEPLAAWPNIPGHSEVIGPFVSIQPVSKRKSTMLPNEPWIVGIPHNYGRVASKETVLYMIEAGPTGLPIEQGVTKVRPVEMISWRDLHTTDVVSGDKHYLEVRLPKLCPVTFAPCVRLKRDCADIGRSGGRLCCLSDPRVTMTAPPGALKVDLPFFIQIQHLDYSQVPILKEQNKSLMNEFISCSPFIYLTCARKILFKPITFTIPIGESQTLHSLTVSPAIIDRMTGERRTGEDFQGSVVHKPSTVSVYDNFQKSLILPQLLSGQRTDDFGIALMKKTSGSNSEWKLWTDAKEVTCDGDVVTFNVNQIEPCRMIALKLRNICDAEIICRCAALLEQSLSQHLVYIALRQHQKQPQQLCLILVLPDQLESALQAISDEGYTEGDKPHGPVFLRERQNVDVSFKSNIRLIEKDSELSREKRSNFSLTFNPAVVNRHKLTVEAIDKSAQIGLDSYRGFMDIFCMREILTTFISGRPLPATPEITSGPRVSIIPARSRKARFQVKTERTHLARIVIKLPKVPMPSEARLADQNFVFQPNDVITTSYLRELSKKLPGDMWRRLGLALDLPRSRIQAIGGKAAVGVEDHAYAMFISWIKTLPVSADRANILRRALLSIGRNDLANEMFDYMEEESANSNN